MPTNNVHDERQYLRTLLASDYGQFKTVIFGDVLARLPVNKNLHEVIEDHLRQKYGDDYAAETDLP